MYLEKKHFTTAHYSKNMYKSANLKNVTQTCNTVCHLRG